MTQELFDSLLEQGESNTLDYKLTHYFDNQGNGAGAKDMDVVFIKDILAFTNTVRDETAYILIGVKGENGKGTPVGIHEYDKIDNALLQQKIRSKVHPTPVFRCYPFTANDGKQFEIISIPVEWYPTPCVPNSNLKPNFLEKNSVYFRADSSNSEADQIEIKRINDWLDKIAISNPKKKNHVKTDNNEVFFTEENILKLFGNEAAENESLLRLKEYYYKHETYEKITVDLPIRIVVGHKGVGKSALFKIAMSEDIEKGKLAVLIKPDEVNDLGKGENEFLNVIKSWKKGLIEIIFKKSLTLLGVKSKPDITFDDLNGNFIEVLNDILFDSLESNNILHTKVAYVNKFLETPIINIYVDDLDRGWTGGKTDLNRISALINAIRDITQENTNLQFKVSLRSDVYFLYRKSDESTDKIGSSVIWYQWTQHEILIVLVKRVRTFFGKDVDLQFLASATQSEIASSLNSIIEPTFSDFGKWEFVPMHQVLMSVIRKRPRDLVKLLILAARNANKRNSKIIQTKDFKEIFNEYSLERIQDTVNEYRSELPQIEQLILGMKPDRKFKGFYYTRPELMQKINNIMSNGRFYFDSNPNAKVEAQNLAQFLYKINFITATKKLPDGYIDRKDFEENQYLSNEFADFGYDWEVHMAFRWGLLPNLQDAIFSELNK